MADKHNEDTKGQNVRVVLRCRPMSSKEMHHEKPVIHCTSERHCEVTYNSLGKTAKKAFQFDGVYDQQTSQEEIYDRVVRPVVDEVLQGYNCTVFAYGQTGTGKTYTMEGQVEGTNKSKDAGVVPRAVGHIFKYLDDNEIEYQVRLSVVELYNEELSDLIAACEDDSKGQLRKLRLLEDPKKGVVLQGVEERPVNTAKDIFDILEGTNKQRKTAETLCNKVSSRSHSIFTLRIFMKEKTVDEEELIKTGTLNLVDLAGSECVGRSGAIGDRKKEAGQINQSLLTLGRVITALVDHQPHVPYRESKLTRLLQESLGGKTKTLIIATVSPSSGNIEETMSTLDYACRAKNIKNTPEINQVQTKKTMMREIAKQVADLQEQLKAQREGNGVYLPTSKFEEMQTELARLREIETILQAEIDEKTSLYDDLDKAFTETKAILAETESNLVSTKVDLKETQEVLEGTKQKLQTTETVLHETSAVLTETKATGAVLFDQGNQVLHKSRGMKTDLMELFLKLERHDNKFENNQSNINKFKVDFEEQAMRAHDHLSDFNNEHAKRFHNLERLVAEFVVAKNEEIQGLKEKLATLQASFTQHLDGVQASLCDHKEDTNVKTAAIATSAQKHAGTLRETVVKHVQDLQKEGDVLQENLSAAHKSVLAWAQNTVAAVQEEKEAVASFVSSNEEEMTALNEVVSSSAAREKAALSEQRNALGAIVQAQADCMAAMEEEMTSRVQKMLSEAFAKQRAQLTQDITKVVEAIGTSEAGLDSLSAQTTESLDNAKATRGRFVSTLDACWDGHKLSAEQSKNALAQMNSDGLNTIVSMRDTVSQHQKSIDGLAESYQNEASDLAKICNNATVAAFTCEQKRDSAIRTLQSTQNSAMVMMMEEACASGEQRGEKLSSDLRFTLSQAENAYITAQSLNTNLRETNANLALSPLMPTGKTPVKTELVLPEALPSFREDQDIIAEWHARHPNPGPPQLTRAPSSNICLGNVAVELAMDAASSAEEQLPRPESPHAHPELNKDSSAELQKEKRSLSKERESEMPLEQSLTNTVTSRIRPPSSKGVSQAHKPLQRGRSGTRSTAADKENTA